MWVVLGMQSTGLVAVITVMSSPTWSSSYATPSSSIQHAEAEFVKSAREASVASSVVFNFVVIFLIQVS